MRKARIENGTVFEILDSGTAPFPEFTPELIWVECDTSVKQGWAYDGKNFKAPVEQVGDMPANNTHLPTGVGSGPSPATDIQQHDSIQQA